MQRKYKVKSKQTIDTVNSLLDSGIEKISVLIRHSARFFSEDASLEAFMGLTDEGKAFAADFGAGLRTTPRPQICSSCFGRCIETAYLIDKGFTQKNNQSLDHNCMEDMLAPFYIKDFEKALECLVKQGTAHFLRDWFDNRLDRRVMECPEKTADLLTRFMIDQIKNLKVNTVSICVSHDWNIFPLKEFKMGLKHESSGDVDYLDGVVFFEKEKQYYITNYQTAPILLSGITQ